MKLNKDLPERFTRAIEKLYTAFHDGTLESQDCSKCAVGNICNGYSYWFGGRYLTDNKIVYPISGGANVGREVTNITAINISGYNGKELATIEAKFMIETYRTETKETQFKGLCAVVEYLCKLEGIDNIMDYSKLFETEDNVAKYELTK
jgi:hypothetical protein